MPGPGDLGPVQPQEQPQVPAVPAVGIALSGGAAKGDFEVGAVRYLYQEGIRPRILCGSSVGAINALKLAEGEATAPAADGYVQGLPGLVSIWSSLQKDQNMWSVDQEFQSLWDAFQALDTDTIRAELKGLLTEAAVGTIASLAAPLPMFPTAALAAIAETGDTFTGIGDIIKFAIDHFKTVRAVANLDPIFAKMREPASFRQALVKASGIKLRLVCAALGEGDVRYVDESGQILSRAGQPIGVTLGDPANVADLKSQIEQLNHDIENLELHENPHGANPDGGKIEEKRARIARLQKQVEYDAEGLRLGALASSAIPIVFPPVRIPPEGIDGNHDWYVDGGTMMLIPVEAAIRAGATIVYAVCTSHQGSERVPASTFDRNSPLGETKVFALDLTKRLAMDMENHEVAQQNLFPREGWGVPVVVIQPEFEPPYVDGFSVDPGLIRIRMDHGFMRADDTVQSYNQNHGELANIITRAGGTDLISRSLELARNTPEIVKLRYGIWFNEMLVNKKSFKPARKFPPVFHSLEALETFDPAIWKTIVRDKRKVKDLVEDRIAKGGKCPPECATWWSDWEKHPTELNLPPWSGKLLEPLPSPSTVKRNQAVSLRVVVLDVFSNQPVSNASVFIDGAKVGPAGQTLPSHTFTWSLGDIPTVTVQAPGYPEAEVSIHFIP